MKITKKLLLAMMFLLPTQAFATAPNVLDSSTTQNCHTGDLTETQLYDFSIAGGSLPANGCLDIPLGYSRPTPQTGTAQLRVYLGGTGGTKYWEPSGFSATTRIGQATVRICANGATNAQKGMQSLTGNTAVGVFTQASTTSALDMTIAQHITVTGQLSNTGDTICVENVAPTVVAH